jgi:hypothetical protein
MDSARAFFLRLLAGCFVFFPASIRPAEPTDSPKNRIGAANLFSNRLPVQIEIELTETDIKALKQDSRKYVRATVFEGDNIYRDVGLHLKGSAGSFRQIDDPKPAFTLSFNQFNSNQRFHGLRKIHLNNSVQDASYLNELLAGELFRAAGVPATRVTHAMVQFNGRQLEGLYVLKEGFTRDFLAEHFKKTSGNLYDMDPGREITEKLKKDAGDGPNDWSDLKALADAAKEPDLAKRWGALNKVLEVDRFVAFMVMEIMTCHWDGYCLGRNNFRIYNNRDDGKMLFFPHGTDQLFQNASAPIRPPMQGLLAQSVIRTPQGRRLYREKFGTLFTNVFNVGVLTSRVERVTTDLMPFLATYDPRWSTEFRNQANGVKDRIVQRGAEIQRQLALPELKPLQFVSNVARPTNWRIENQPNLARVERANDDSRSVFHIVAPTNSAASWRSKVILDGGRYRFEGIARSHGIVPLKDDIKGGGAGLRISQQSRTNVLLGDNVWSKLQFDFEAASPDDEVELVCELRADKGEVWFDIDSLRVIRLP